MKRNFLEVSISAENKEQADEILNALLTQKLITGGQIHQEPARFLWKGDIVDMDYVVIKSFTVEKYKPRIIEVAKTHSREEVPMIWFNEIDGNSELLAWIDTTLG